MSQMALLGYFLRLAVVNVLSNLMVPLAGLVDLAFLGHLTEIHYLSGVALATVVFNYLYWSFGFLRMGTTGMTAQAFGQQDRQEVQLILWRNLGIALLLALLIVLLQQPIQAISFRLLSAPSAVRQSGIAYFQAMIWGAPPTLLNYVLVGWFLGQGQSARVLLLAIVSNGTNVGLNYWLIVRLGWASAGAGYATAGSQYIMLLVALMMLMPQQSRAIQLVPISAVWQLQKLRQVFVLNGEILIRTFSLLSAFALFTNISSAISPIALALNALLLQLVSVAAYLIDGFAYAMETCAGQLYGKRDASALQYLLKVAIAAGISIALMMALLFNLQSNKLLGLLTSHDNLIVQAAHYMPWLFPVLGFGAIAYILDGYFLGLTCGRILRQSSLIATLIGFMPIALLSWQQQNLQMLWLAMTMFMATRASTLSLQLKRLGTPRSQLIR